MNSGNCRRPGLVFWPGALFALLTVWASLVSAQPPRRVVVLLSPSAQPLERELDVRLRAELAATGFEVVSLARPFDDEPQTAAATLGGEHQPVAVFAIAAQPVIDAAGERSSTLQLWISDRQEAALAQLAREHAFEGSRAASSLAVQGVEWLQARLATFRWPAERAPLVLAPPPAPAPGSPPQLIPALDMGLLLDSETGAAALTPLLRLSYLASAGPNPGLRWGSRLSAAGLGTATVLETSLRRIEVWQSFALLEALAQLRAQSWLHPFSSVGLGGYHVSVEGSGPSPLLGRSEATFSALGSIGAGLVLLPGGGWVGKLEAQGLFALQPTAVEIESTRVATFGRPLWLFSVGVGIAL